MAMDIRKGKRMLKPPLPISQHFSYRSLTFCFIFISFLFLLSHHLRFHSVRFRPHVVVPNLSGWSKSAVGNSVQRLMSRDVKLVQQFWIESTVVFPDSVLVVLKTAIPQHTLLRSQQIDCSYHSFENGTSVQGLEDANGKVIIHKALSAEEYDVLSWIIRCPTPPLNYTEAIEIQGRRVDAAGYDWRAWMDNQTVKSWDRVTYEAVLDRDTVVVFAKGLNLRSDRESDPSKFSCHFGVRNSDGFPLRSRAITAAEEAFRCPLPRILKMNMDKIEGVRVTVGVTSAPRRRRRANERGNLHQLLPSVAKIQQNKSEKYNKVDNKKFKLCACSMVWNQASAIREWITYHAWLGVERWFIYDNNSDDGLKDVIKELDLENYNVSRHIWPWIKTQEAGFSHCVVRAREECSWVGFFDVDEFFFLPPKSQRGDYNMVYPGQNSLQAMVADHSSNETIAEIRTTCHSFGPSGLKSPPPKGLSLGYTCRLISPERHKSILRPDAVDDTLMNAIHHFRLRKGFEFLNLPISTAVVNHYKYQVWDVFKAKFVRRVSTYVADWQENQKEGSRDRAPGLGTEPIEPPDWHLRFCEIRDTGLRDFVLTNLADPTTGMLPWEKPARL